MPKQCRCGCESESSWLVKSFDFDPQQPGGLGRYYEEQSCLSAMLYMQESAHELGFPFEKEYIGDPAFEQMERRAV